MKAVFNWSGGKDSTYALYKCLNEKKYDVKFLLTSLNAENNRVSMHGVRLELLKQQAENIGIELVMSSLEKNISMENYEKIMFSLMQNLKNKGIDYSIFGDIFLEDLRIFRETQLEKVKIKAVFPLWKINTYELINKFIDEGFKTIVTAVDNSKLNKDFVGRIIDKQFIVDLPKNVDPCGENGEYHTFVFDGPIFKKPISFIVGEKIYKEYKLGTCTDFKDENGEKSVKNAGFWFCDLIPTNL